MKVIYLTGFFVCFLAQTMNKLDGSVSHSFPLLSKPVTSFHQQTFTFAK
jgi:hypothetical protein